MKKIFLPLLFMAAGCSVVPKENSSRTTASVESSCAEVIVNDAGSSDLYYFPLLNAKGNESYKDGINRYGYQKAWRTETVQSSTIVGEKCQPVRAIRGGDVVYFGYAYGGTYRIVIKNHTDVQNVYYEYTGLSSQVARLKPRYKVKKVEVGVRIFPGEVIGYLAKNYHLGVSLLRLQVFTSSDPTELLDSAVRD